MSITGLSNMGKSGNTSANKTDLFASSGPLARTKFYRAIADEAQFIRNRSSLATIHPTYPYHHYSGRRVPAFV